MKKNHKGFTLIELLIVIAIISLLSTTVLPRLSNVRANGDDARRKVTLKSLQSEIALQTDTGVSGYSNIFSTSGETKTKLDTLIAQTGVAGADYDARSDATSYAVVFPLKADPSKYWCIDASGVSKEVSGRLSISGSPSCGNVVNGYSYAGCPNVTRFQLRTDTPEMTALMYRLSDEFFGLDGAPFPTCTGNDAMSYVYNNAPGLPEMMITYTLEMRTLPNNTPYAYIAYEYQLPNTTAHAIGVGAVINNNTQYGDSLCGFSTNTEDYMSSTLASLIAECNQNIANY